MIPPMENEPIVGKAGDVFVLIFDRLQVAPSFAHKGQDRETNITGEQCAGVFLRTPNRDAPPDQHADENQAAKSHNQCHRLGRSRPIARWRSRPFRCDNIGYDERPREPDSM